MRWYNLLNSLEWLGITSDMLCDLMVYSFKLITIGAVVLFVFLAPSLIPLLKRKVKPSQTTIIHDAMRQNKEKYKG